MEMNRRFFLAIAASAGMDPERLLWVPGRKLISIAAPLDVVPVEVLFGMPDLMPFNVPITARVRALLAQDPDWQTMAEQSGTVRFTKDAPGYDFSEARNRFKVAPWRSCSYDVGNPIIIPGQTNRPLGSYKIG